MEQQQQISLDQTSGIICPVCKSPFFKEVLIMRKVSRFITGALADIISPVPVVVCNHCSTILAEALPPALAEMFRAESEEITSEPTVEPPTIGAKIIQMVPR